MKDRNRVKTAIVPLVLSAAFVAALFAEADAEDTIVRITEPAGLTVNLKAVPPTAEAPAVIQLKGSIEGGTPPFTYTLTFGDGQTEEGTTDTGEVVIDHEYVESGTYMASFSAKDADGRTGTSAVAPSASRGGRIRTDDASVGVDVVRVPVGRKTPRRGRRSRRRSKPIITWSDITTPEEEEVAEETVEEDVPVVAPEEALVEEKKPARRRSWRFWRRRPKEPEETVAEEVLEAEPEEKPEVAAAEKKPARRRGWRFWRRRRKTPEPEEEPKVVTEEDKEKAAAEAAAVAAAAEEREARRREALALALEERIAALVGLQEAEQVGRPGISRVRGEDETEKPGKRLRRLAPAVKSGLWPKTWELDFEYEPPRRLVVKSDWKGDAGKPYWYMIYRVTNSGENPIKLNMDVELRTKKGVCSEVYSPRALKTVRAKERRKLASFMDMPENLEPDASSEAVAVFSDVSDEATDYDLIISGLNNTYRVEGEEFRMFRRVLVISYERPGDEFQVEYDRMKYKDAVWVEEEFSRK